MRSNLFKSSATPPPLTVSIVNHMIESSEKIINRWSNSSNSDLYTISSCFVASDSREEVNKFISAVHKLQAAIGFLESTNVSSKLLHHSHHLVRIAMKRLKSEFHQILGKQFVSEVNSKDLRSVAECMMNCGFSKECVKIFKTVRKSVVDEELQRLRVDRLSLNLQFHKLRWDVEIEDKIRNWLSATGIAVKSIFSDERNLCDLVFSSSPEIRESCFTAITRDSAISLFVFPEQVASKCKKSPEKLFRFLDLYEAIQELSPEINYIFSSESSSPVQSQAEISMTKLGEAARTTLSEFESAIQKDCSKTPITGGGVHPLTSYVMNYLSLLANYTAVLESILADWPLNLQAPLPEDYFGFSENISNLDARFIWLTLVLLSKLDRESDLYKDVSLSYLFLANNLQYIVGKVRTSELRRIISDDSVTKQEEKARQYAASYERLGWSKVMDSFTDDNTTGEMDSLERAREKFRRFNTAFLEVQGSQMEWVVVDQKLRVEIKESLGRKIVPEYRKMYELYGDRLASSKKVIVRYTPEDLENYLWGLLFGCSDS